MRLPAGTRRTCVSGLCVGPRGFSGVGVRRRRRAALLGSPGRLGALGCRRASRLLGCRRAGRLGALGCRNAGRIGAFGCRGAGRIGALGCRCAGRLGSCRRLGTVGAFGRSGGSGLRVLVRVGRFFPSTQLYSTCQALTGPKGQSGLHVRTWTCANCGVTHDRDENAARNLLAEGLRLLAEGGQPSVAGGQPETENACGAEVSPSPAMAHGEEAGRRAGDRVHAAA